MRLRISRFAVGLLHVWITSAAGPARGEVVIEGPTMGTTFRVLIAQSGSALAKPEMERAVGAVLERVDARMSTYRPESELERFNQQHGTQWHAVSEETAQVAEAARELALLSEGAFDPTVGPLVSVWGFGRGDRTIPTPEQLTAAQAVVGFRHFDVRRRPPALRKGRPELELDLSGIAKGYAVDAITLRLLEMGVESSLVEVGGEIRALGSSPRGGPWIVEIELPFPEHESPARVALRDHAIATSGPYRNFLVQEGVRLSHVLDPRSGVPVASDLISVSVIASSAMQADGWATALLVAGPELGWELARRENLAVLFVSARDGEWRRRATPSFDRHLLDTRTPEETQP